MPCSCRTTPFAKPSWRVFVIEIRVPKLNNNDRAYILIDWLIDNDQEVASGEAIAALETSKAVEDLLSADDGILQHLLAAGAECAPGDVIARIVPPGTGEIPVPATGAVEPAEPVGQFVTAPAQELIDRLGIDPRSVRELPVKVVRAADVERLAASRPQHSDARLHTLQQHQRAVAETVSLSHRTIPAAYTVMKVDVGAARAEVRRQSMSLRALVDLPDLLIAAVARLQGDHPLFFASPVDDHRARLSGQANVGVTMDAGTGLFVPVVHGAADLSFRELVAVLGRYRQAARTGRFHASDLNGGNISVTLHNDEDVVVAVPLIAPGQTCALALGGPQQEVTVDGEAGVSARTVIHVGLAYDHRFINGRDAVQFLRGVKAAVEAPADLVGNR
ncbi:2-oxo acid dehydrogenase subunit E2 [Micromonospora sp. NPDC049240]|uniref:2-oxo acid dehydrogenase subunit E2 n=1 Tax=Micromonospora sp. NPDC049240 TaxID=3155151 RepID=UPI0033C9230D